MIKKNTRLILAMQTIIGSIIGVGIFGLPYVASQAGFFMNTAFIIIAGIVYATTLILFAEVIMYTPGHSRIAGLAEKYLGHHWKIPASFFQYTSSWGAMLGYTILGGSFLHAILQPWINIPLTTAQYLFVIISSLTLLGGLGLVAYIQAYFFWIISILIIAMLVFGLPYADFSQLLNIDWQYWSLPLGVVLFAFGGFAAIPEAADILNSERDKLRRAVILSVAFCALVYIIFSGTVLIVTGQGTTQDALIGFSEVIGPWFVIASSIVGLFSVFSSFVVLGISNLDGLLHDFKMRYLNSWLIVSVVPITIFALGARNFINVIGFTGGLIASLIGLIIIRMYKKAKHDVCMPKRCLNIPNFLIIFCQLVFLLGIILQIIGD